MSKFDKMLARVEEWTVFLCVLFTTFAIALNVVMRNVFQYPLSWPDELGRYLLILVIFLGYIIAVRKDSEIKLDLVYRLFPGFRKLFFTLSHLASILFSVLLVILGFKYMLLKYRLETKSVILEFPMWILALVLLVICGSLMCYRYLYRMLREGKEEIKGE